MSDPGETRVAGAFTASEDGRRWVYSGGLTFDNADDVIQAARELPLPSTGHVDLAALEPADSSALAVLFALKRRAKSERKTLAFEQMPPGLASLAKVYGVEDLLGAHPPASHPSP